VLQYYKTTVRDRGGHRMGRPGQRSIPRRNGGSGAERGLEVGPNGLMVGVFLVVW